MKIILSFMPLSGSQAVAGSRGVVVTQVPIRKLEEGEPNNETSQF